MSETKFTNGPWRAGIAKNGKFVTWGGHIEAVADGLGIAEIALGTETPTDAVTREVATANAHLIETAPEMYAELEAIYTEMAEEPLQYEDEDRWRIGALLKKARGEK